MTTNTYVLTEDQIAVAWGDRGPFHVMDRDGTVSEQYRLPAGETITADMEGLDSLEQGALEGAVARLRACSAGKRLAAKTLDALAAAVQGES